MNLDTPTQVMMLRYDLGDIVYHRLGTERRRGMITGVAIAPDGHSYWVTWPDRGETRHYEIELTSEYVPDYESA